MVIHFKERNIFAFALSACCLSFSSFVLAQAGGAEMRVPVTAFSNMEKGWQITNRGYRAILKDGQGKAIMAGPMSLEASIQGERMDPGPGNATAPRLLLHIASTFVASGLPTDNAVQKGVLSICMAKDQNAAIEATTCETLQSSTPEHGGVVRNFQLIDVPVDYKVEGKNIRIQRYNLDQGGSSPTRIGPEGSPEAIDVSVYHTAYQAFHPKKAFKDNQSPLVFDLDRDREVSLVDAWDKKSQAYFDHEGDGIKNKTGWFEANDGILCLDRNGDGIINDGRELFGVYSYADVVSNSVERRFNNGFEALAQFDHNGDEWINKEDPAFKFLRIWRDKNLNGISEKSELFTLTQVGVTSVSLDFQENRDQDGQFVKQFGNEMRLSGNYLASDSNYYPVYDVWFKQRRQDVKKR